MSASAVGLFCRESNMDVIRRKTNDYLGYLGSVRCRSCKPAMTTTTTATIITRESFCPGMLWSPELTSSPFTYKMRLTNTLRKNDSIGNICW
jgi:hypothetical protein